MMIGNKMDRTFGKFGAINFKPILIVLGKLSWLIENPPSQVSLFMVRSLCTSQERLIMYDLYVRMCNKLGLASYMLNYPQNRFSNFFTLVHSSLS